LTIIYAQDCTNESTDDKNIRLDYIDEAWSQIKASTASTQPTEGERVKRINEEYWFDIAQQCKVVFDEAAKIAEDRDELDYFMRKYVSFFGVDGPEADIRWGLACPELCTNSRLYFMRKLSTSESVVFSAFSRAILDACLKSCQFRDRFGWFSLWLGTTDKSESYPFTAYEA